MKEGLDLTMKQLDTAMEKFNIVEVDPQPGESLDLDRHQAMGLVDAEGIESNCIAQVIQKGYTINDRLLRPAMVMVAAARLEMVVLEPLVMDKSPEFTVVMFRLLKSRPPALLEKLAQFNALEDSCRVDAPEWTMAG